MKLPIKVVLLDDEEDEFIRDFRQSARTNRVMIEEQFKNAKDGIKYIKENYSDIDAIIIDGFFLAHKDSSKKKNKQALKQTIDTLKELLLRDGISIPYCILTGYLGDLQEDSLLLDAQVFKKGADDTKLFDYLIKKVAENEDYQIKANFSEIFELFDRNLLPNDKKQDLVEVLKKIDSKAKYNQDDAFTPLRKMYEAFVKCFYEEAFSYNKYQDYVHQELFNGNQVNIKGSWFYFSGKPVKWSGKTKISAREKSVWPEHIKNITSGFVDLIQTESHDYEEDVTHYAYKSAVYALLELLIWYKNFCITNFNR